MQDNPNEQSKPRFLARDDGGSRQTGAYRGRFLNRQPSEDNAESPQESDAIPADIREGPESPLQSADAPFDASEPAQDDLSQEALRSQESTDFQDSDVSYGDDGDFSNFEAPEIPEDTDASEDAAYTEYTNDVSPVQESLSEEDAEFQELFSAEPPQEDDIPVRDHPASKGRPKRRGGEGFLGIPNILVTIVWIAITVAIGVTLGRMAWVCAADVLAFGREDTKVTITISSTDDIDAIAQKLKNAGLIRYPGLFKLYASFAVDEGEIQPGIWDLNTLYDYHALVNMMSPSSKRSVVTVMIPEGSSCRQIFQLLLYPLHTETVSKGSIDVHGFKRNCASLAFRLSVESAHIVKSVRKLYEYNTDVLRHCKKHLAKAFHMGVFLVLYAYLNELC